MDNLKKAMWFTAIITVINVIISVALYYFKGEPEFRGYITGTLLNLIFAVLWVLGARKGMKSNTIVLLIITLGGFPVRLGILLVFALGGLYLFQMDTTFFALAFLVCTIFSLVIEVWFFNNLRFPEYKKFKAK
jgi:hypothetical protein